MMDKDRWRRAGVLYQSEAGGRKEYTCSSVIKHTLQHSGTLRYIPAHTQHISTDTGYAARTTIVSTQMVFPGFYCGV